MISKQNREYASRSKSTESASKIKQKVKKNDIASKPRRRSTDQGKGQGHMEVNVKGR